MKTKNIVHRQTFATGSNSTAKSKAFTTWFFIPQKNIWAITLFKLHGLCNRREPTPPYDFKTENRPSTYFICLIYSAGFQCNHSFSKLSLNFKQNVIQSWLFNNLLLNFCIITVRGFIYVVLNVRKIFSHKKNRKHRVSIMISRIFNEVSS